MAPYNGLSVVFSHVTGNNMTGKTLLHCKSNSGQHYRTTVFFSPVLSQDYLNPICTEEKQRYEKKPQVLVTCDPYSNPAALFKSLKVATSLRLSLTSSVRQGRRPVSNHMTTTSCKAKNVYFLASCELLLVVPMKLMQLARSSLMQD